MEHLHSNVLNNKSSTGNVEEDRSSPLLIWDSFSQKLCLFLLLLPPPNKTYSCYIFLDQTFWWKTKQKSQRKWKKTVQKIFLLCVEYFLHKSKRKWSQSWRTVVNRCAQKIPRSVIGSQLLWRSEKNRSSDHSNCFQLDNIWQICLIMMYCLYRSPHWYVTHVAAI